MKSSRSTHLFLIISLGILLASGCMVELGESVGGTLTRSDQHGTDSNDLLFYYDTYRLPVRYGNQYRVELYSESSHIVFEGDMEDTILHASDTGYAETVFTAESTYGEYYVYVRSDFLLDGDIGYRFTVIEE